jgi:hypothetical protein
MVAPFTTRRFNTRSATIQLFTVTLPGRKGEKILFQGRHPHLGWRQKLVFVPPCLNFYHLEYFAFKIIEV